MPYYAEEDYEYDRPGYRRTRHSSHTLDIDPRRHEGRSRSRGVSPAPVVNIYNDQYQDVRNRNESPYPYAPAPPPMPVYYEQRHRHRSPSSHDSRESRGRRHSSLRDPLVEEMAELALRERLRSRSRGRSDAAMADRTQFYQWQLEQKERDLEESQRRKLLERELELKHLKEREKEAKAHEEAEEREKLLLKEYEEKKRKEADRVKREEQEIRDKIEREEREAKEKRERQREQFEREEKEAKEKKERQRQEFLREEKEREEKIKAEKKAEKDKFEHEMRRRLENLGYTQAQIDFMVDEERTKQFKEGGGQSSSRVVESKTVSIYNSRAPVYPKIHRDYLSVETLTFYEIPYEKDPLDPNYIIVLREMDKYETEVLFAHTKRLREGKLLIEGHKDKKEDKQYAWFRKRDRSRSRVRQVGILEFK